MISFHSCISGLVELKIDEDGFLVRAMSMTRGGLLEPQHNNKGEASFFWNLRR